ncbi:hypothetical protein [Neobacillus mesonae]|uniref:hypothetical protein n=1 Tax=Neobacillus mesonae TaxID=1193713 RepID=UPI00204142CC|nr:hypothetical protein [Neobacillus mesonae]MCM3567863.1 hypothetical protein [Neobacillus mesonae]
MGKEKAKGETLYDSEILTGEFARLVGKTPQWIRQLTRDGVLKQCKRGKYFLGENLQAYIEHVQGGKEDSKKPRYVDAKTEHELIKKEKAELELRAIKGQLHEAKDVRAVMTDMILTTKSKLQSIPARVSPQLDGEPASKIEKVLNTEISEALRSLSNYSPEQFMKSESDD